MFVTDSGTAIPIANTLDILGGHIAASGTPIHTTGSTNVVTVNIQAASAQAGSSATNMGGASFNSAEFTVDANGFVSLAAGGAAETLTGNSGGAVSPDGSNNINVVGDTTTITIAGNPGTHTLTASVTGSVGQTITGDSGGALSPTAGNWNILGSSPVAGTSPVTTSGSVSTLTVNVQKSQAIAATDATKIGLSAFDSSSFNVDSNGFVTLKGGSEAIDSIGVDSSTAPGTNPVLPNSSGLLTITGAQVASGTVGANVIRTDSLAANTLTVEIQRSTTNATTDSTKNGVSHYDSSKFTVDSNGFVSTSGTGVLNTLTGNSGGAISPTAGNINTLGTGSITISGSGSTLTTQLTGLTNHNVLIGAGTATITNVSPSATTGIPLVSNGASADPSFSTAVVAGGGTGSTSFNTNGVVISNTTTTGSLSSLSLSSGQVVIGGTTTPAAATLTAGTGISISNGNNSITINATGSGIGWTDVTGTSASMAVNNGYVSDNAGLVTLTLPSTAAFGSVINIVGKGAGGWRVAQNSGQQIILGSSSTTVGVTGRIDSTNQYDCVELLCVTQDTTFVIISSVGNISFT